MAGTVRLTMFVVEHAPNGDGPTRRRASLKLILSTEALMDGIVMTLGALATAGTQSTQRVVSGVVH